MSLGRSLEVVEIHCAQFLGYPIPKIGDTKARSISNHNHTFTMILTTGKRINTSSAVFGEDDALVKVAR